MSCGTSAPAVPPVGAAATLAPAQREPAQCGPDPCRPALLDWLTLAMALDLALIQFLPVAHDLDPVEHSRPLVFWYGFPLVWLAGPEPGELVSQPIRNWALPALGLDMLLLCAGPLAVRHWLLGLAAPHDSQPQFRSVPLREVVSQSMAFSLRRMLWAFIVYGLSCAIWLSPHWSFLCTGWTCKLVINRGLLGTAAYVPLVLPAILISSIALAVLAQLALTAGRRAWLRRHRPRYRPGGAELLPGSPAAGSLAGNS